MTEALLHFDRAREELAHATAIDEVKAVRDKAEALRLYSRQAGHGLEMQNQCAEIKLRAERRAGGLLKDMEKAEGSRGQLVGRGVIGGRVARQPKAEPAPASRGASIKTWRW